MKARGSTMRLMRFNDAGPQSSSGQIWGIQVDLIHWDDFDLA